MSRIALIEPESASPEVKEIYDGPLKSKPGSIQKALAHRPALLKNFLPFYASIGRSLDRRLYEMLYLHVSLINGCHYCTQHHIQGSTLAGLTLDEMRAIKAADLSHFTEQEQLALTYAEKLTRTPNAATDADFAALHAHFSDQQIMDLHALIALANFTNRITGPLALQVEFPETEL